MSDRKRTSRIGIVVAVLWTASMVFFGWALATSAVGCGTISGLGTDLRDAANWTQERIDNGFNRPK